MENFHGSSSETRQSRSGMTQTAFDREVAQISPRLLAYFRNRVGDVATAEDLRQEALLKAYRMRAALRDKTRFEPWLFRIAHGTIVDHYRKRGSKKESAPYLAAEN